MTRSTSNTGANASAYTIAPVPFPQSVPAKHAGRRLPRLGRMALIHTCYRITDIDRSVAFYNALGFEEMARLPIRDEAVNVFMNQPGDGDMPRLELTYNFGVDAYEIGSGYGHIAITAEDLDATLSRLAEQGIEPEKPPYSVREGGSRLCFVRDPDGYRVELIEQV
jgi:lactoylglutathione lyase